MSDEDGWLRAATFGGMDGLVTSIALVIGLSWAGMDIESVNLSGLSAAGAGAVSMALGEFVSVQTHNEQVNVVKFNPFIAAISSFLCFVMGSVIPLIPLLLGSLQFAIYVGLFALFLAGAFATRYTHRSWWFGGLRQLGFGLTAIAITCIIGNVMV